MALLGIFSPILLQLLTIGGMRRVPETLIDFNHNIVTFFSFFFGTLLVSFIVIFTFYFEYQEDTWKNMLIAPYKKGKILLAKLIYTFLFTAAIFLIGYGFDVLTAGIIGVSLNLPMLKQYLEMFFLMALLFYTIAPLMALLTLIFQGFIAPMLAAIIGSLAGMVAIYSENYLFVPWAIPAKIMLTLQQNTGDNLLPAYLSAAFFFLITFSILFLYFLKTDQR